MDSESSVSTVPPGWGTPMGTPTRKNRIIAAPVARDRSAYVPTAVDRHLQAIDYSHEGHLLMGCSSLSGRLWTGSLWYYSDPKAAPDVENSVTGVDCDNGVVEAIFYGKRSSTMFVGLDNGSVEHIELKFSQEDPVDTSFQFLDNVASLNEHDDLLTGMVLTCDDSKLLTVGYDRAIVAVVADTFALERRWPKAHEDLISAVDANRVATDIFATAANDGLVLGWDIRNKERQSVLLDACGSAPPTSVSWLPEEEHLLLVGTKAGAIHLVDTRKTGESVYVLQQAFDDAIARMRFAKSSRMFAVCADSSLVKVFEVVEGSSIQEKYVDNRHSDFVRGLAWNPLTSELTSCGWDKTVLHHNVGVASS